MPRRPYTIGERLQMIYTVGRVAYENAANAAARLGRSPNYFHYPATSEKYGLVTLRDGFPGSPRAYVRKDIVDREITLQARTDLNRSRLAAATMRPKAETPVVAAPAVETPAIPDTLRDEMRAMLRAEFASFLEQVTAPPVTNE